MRMESCGLSKKTAAKLLEGEVIEGADLKALSDKETGLAGFPMGFLPIRWKRCPPAIVSLSGIPFFL